MLGNKGSILIEVIRKKIKSDRFLDKEEDVLTSVNG